ncbi:winged helix-turn-helix domain-containing protein [Aliivibrio fischeri]|uniref:winged helix-turn-helix domain-containing protein n=1 Tax=Aliivibrio fischeri TaxID=668 RepID=UPI0012DA5148|nr:winged helix-turn-helix domain-containing protein [Aliivibrio fischeri]MUJ38309.1 hypothetical protein [Aliivibrio fischeri]
MASYKINNHVFNTIDRTLTFEGDRKKLSKSEVHLLVFLIENQGQIIEKSKLMAIGWPKKVVVINSLTVAISNLRKAFDNPDIINSNKGVGYTFSAEAVIEHTSSDEIYDEAIIKGYGKNKKEKMITTLYFYSSIIIFLFSCGFAINWLNSYVSR